MVSLWGEGGGEGGWWTGARLWVRTGVGVGRGAMFRVYQRGRLTGVLGRKRVFCASEFALRPCRGSKGGRGRVSTRETEVGMSPGLPVQAGDVRVYLRGSLRG